MASGHVAGKYPVAVCVRCGLSIYYRVTHRGNEVIERDVEHDGVFSRRCGVVSSVGSRYVLVAHGRKRFRRRRVSVPSEIYLSTSVCATSGNGMLWQASQFKKSTATVTACLLARNRPAVQAPSS